MPMPHPPMPTAAAATTLIPPAPLSMPAAPSTTTAVQVKKELTPVIELMKVKEEPVEDTPRTCSNCNTTDASEWKNAVSKDNILCKTCFEYRRAHKENRPILKTVVMKEMRSIMSE
ncbi:hypothetical protein CAEBREN_19428 [Caenorhabditis brenneri]|uniref:GATA-type domain-containing protein n=1 Tax=Caenorhabditis brenneri TaxID=135651 RepID=G0MDV6_CAEBE|nr:hypothetical protein CAEBREN_19428 [Caenorhabditis brenneri]